MRQDLSKILLWDLETSHLKCDFGTLLACGYKWLGENKTKVISLADFNNFKRDPTDDSAITKAFLDIYNQADMTIGYYSSGFDIKFFHGKVLEHGLPVPPKIPMVDLFYTVKANLALSRKSLQNVGYFLGLSAEKTPVEGKIWKAASCGNKKALKYIVDHCRADVEILEEAYLRLRPLVRTHPRVSGYAPCRFCGGKVQSRGPALSVCKGDRKRFQCTSCFGWDTRPVPRLEF